MDTKLPKPYGAILPSILCQQPAVILHWLNTERATGQLPIEIALDCVIELVSRLTIPATGSVDYIKELAAKESELAVYREAVQAMRPFVPLNISSGFTDTTRYQSVEKRKAWSALAAVDKLEGKE